MVLVLFILYAEMFIRVFINQIDIKQTTELEKPFACSVISPVLKLTPRALLLDFSDDDQKA